MMFWTRHNKTVMRNSYLQVAAKRFPHVTSGKKVMCNNKISHKKLAVTGRNERAIYTYIHTYDTYIQLEIVMRRRL